MLWIQLIDCTTLKREVAEGVDLMVVRELTAGQSHAIEFVFIKSTSEYHQWMYSSDSLSSNAGIYFGEPRGFSVNEKGEEIGFNTEVYSVSQVLPYLSMLLKL